MWLSYRVVFLLLTMLCLVRPECPEVVKRADWDALNPLHVKYLVRPVNLVIIQHTVSPPCYTDENCEATMQSVQNYFLDELGAWDIGASFYVGGNAKIYEGAGWVHEGQHTTGYDGVSIGICFIGNYNQLEPSQAQLDVVREFIRCGVEQGHITPVHYVLGQRQLIATQGPGRKLYRVIRTWPEWLEDVSSIKNSTAAA